MHTHKVLYCINFFTKPVRCGLARSIKQANVRQRNEFTIYVDFYMDFRLRVKCTHVFKSLKPILGKFTNPFLAVINVVFYDYPFSVKKCIFEFTNAPNNRNVFTLG